MNEKIETGGGIEDEREKKGKVGREGKETEERGAGSGGFVTVGVWYASHVKMICSGRS